MTAEPTRTGYWATFTVLAAAVAAYALLQSLVIPVLPTIQAGLHTSQNTVTWVLTAYLLSASIFTPIMGRLGDMWGKERMLVVALIALTVGSVLAALTGSIVIMIVARVIQGIGGGVLPLSFGIIRDEFPRVKVAGAVGVKLWATDVLSCFISQEQLAAFCRQVCMALISPEPLKVVDTNCAVERPATNHKEIFRLASNSPPIRK